MSLYKKKNGTSWYWAFRYTDALGKSKLKSISTGISCKPGNKKEAEHQGKLKEAAFLASINNHEIRHKERKLAHIDDTVNDYAIYWLECELGHIKANTCYSYELVVKKHIIPLLGKIKLSDLDQYDLEEFIKKHIEICDSLQAICDEKRKSGKKITNDDKPYYTSIRKIFSILTMMLNNAVANSAIQSNPCTKVKANIRALMPKSKYKEIDKPKTYTIDELNLLITKCKGEVLEPCIMLASFLGLRREEVLGLKWSDIDFTNDIVHIRNTVVTNGGKNEYRDNETKNDASMTDLPLIDELKTYLLALKKQQHQYSKIFGDDYIQSDYICRWTNGKLIKPNYISQTFPKFLKKNNLRNIRFHDIRATVVTLIWEKTGDIKKAQIIARHSNIDITADIYTDVNMNDKRNALNQAFK